MRSPSFGSGLPFQMADSNRQSVDTRRVVFDHIADKFKTFKVEKPNSTKIEDYLIKRNEEQASAVRFANESDTLALKILCQLLYDEVERLCERMDSVNLNSHLSHQQSFYPTLPQSQFANPAIGSIESSYKQVVHVLEQEIDTLKVQIVRKNAMIDNLMANMSRSSPSRVLNFTPDDSQNMIIKDFCVDQISRPQSNKKPERNIKIEESKEDPRKPTPALHAQIQPPTIQTASKPQEKEAQTSEEAIHANNKMKDLVYKCVDYISLLKHSYEYESSVIVSFIENNRLQILECFDECVNTMHDVVYCKCIVSDEDV